MKQPRKKKMGIYPHQKIDPLLLLDHFFMGVLPKSCHVGPLAGTSSRSVSSLLLTLNKLLMSPLPM